LRRLAVLSLISRHQTSNEGKRMNFEVAWNSFRRRLAPVELLWRLIPFAMAIRNILWRSPENRGGIPYNYPHSFIRVELKGTDGAHHGRNLKWPRPSHSVPGLHSPQNLKPGDELVLTIDPVAQRCAGRAWGF